MNLWERTKPVAKIYIGTFIVVMVLNQLLFFGFCLNPICLMAAMPHVLLITAFIGSWINKEAGWGNEKQAGNVGRMCKEGKELVDKSFEQAEIKLKRANELASQKLLKEKYYDVDYAVIETKTLEAPSGKISKSEIDYDVCQTCGAKTVLRTARVGKYSGKKFFGCSKYPTCKGIINIESKKENSNTDFGDDIPF